MIQWVSEDLKFVDYDFTSSRRKSYAKIWFVDNQTKRKIPVFDFSGLDSAAGIIEDCSKRSNVKWWVSGVVNTVGEKHFLLLQRFALMNGNGERVNPYTGEAGFAEVELTN